MDQQRRIFLSNAGRLAALAAAGPALMGASSIVSAPGGVYPFSLGVASGSPLPDSVILWTRILGDPLDAAASPPGPVAVRWEVAEDEAFARLVAKGTASALPALAHSVHVDVTGLAPGRWYWYRFMLGNAVSPPGRTRTAPAPDSLPSMLKLVVASCQHWEFGSYAAHRHIASAAPDLVAFLGDYIYEWGPFHLAHPHKSVRSNECFTLDEYRARYAQYKSDPDLQSAHLAAPWIVTWDDHEVSNDYAADRDERLAPDFLLRRANAYQAFYEHMPLRMAPPRAGGFAHLRMYQRYDWGRLARFHVLDDRQYRAHQACQPPGRGGSSSVLRSGCDELSDARRSMLGGEQEAWLASGLGSSQARWNIIAQQTPMAQSSQTSIITPRDGRFWTDGWDGYPLARQRLFDTLRASGAANPIVLAGDVHSFYASELKSDFQRSASAANPVIATEFCGTSVTSNSRAQARTQRYVDFNAHVKFGRSDRRGYMLMEFTPSRTTTHFMALDDVRDPGSAVGTLATFQVAHGQPGVNQV